MRIFLALPLPQAAREALAAARDMLRAEAPRLTWVGEDSWHITLAFLGDQGEAGLAAAQAGLARLEAQGLEVPRLQLARLLSFPSRGPWRVLAAGIAHPESLGVVYTALNLALAEEGRKRGLEPLNPEWEGQGSKAGRPWKPHVTLARNRPQGLGLPSRTCLSRAGDILEEASVEGGWPLEAALLYKSELRPGGAVYTGLDRAIFRPR